MDGQDSQDKGIKPFCILSILYIHVIYCVLMFKVLVAFTNEELASMKVQCLPQVYI